MPLDEPIQAEVTPDVPRRQGGRVRPGLFADWTMPIRKRFLALVM